MNQWDVLRQLAHPIVLTYILSMLMINLIAAMTALLLIGAVLPIPVLEDPEGVWERNVGWFLLAVPFAAATFGGLHLRYSWPNLMWLARGGTPRAYEAHVALGQTKRQVMIESGAWVAATFCFVVVNLAARSPELLVLIVITTALVGSVSVTLGYIIGERMLRPLTAIAMSVRFPAAHTAPGVGTRIVLIWGLTTAVPVLGVVMISVSQITDHAGPAATEMNTAVLVLSLIAMIIGFVGIIVMARSISDPLQQVSDAMHRVEAGDLSTRAAVYDGSEIGQLQAGFNSMVKGLAERERLAELFSKHVGEEVARAALEHGNARGGALRKVSALFIDLTGSTRLAAEKPPEVVVAALNEFFELVVDTVSEHGGFVSKFEGDAAVAVFGAPLEIPDSVTPALQCARDMRATLHARIALDFGIGVAFGSALAGNIGAAERFEYTVLGMPVIKATQLSDHAKTRPSRVLATVEAINAADSDEAAQWQIIRLGDLTVAEPLLAARLSDGARKTTGGAPS
ncbi:adenylate/guanylate cyclase domain-containing protein [Hoyosella sp. YIM 151337]|uniref:adenylate/guanylate cyclase domain-containing protein n=1 Tax=Hoyosella sp. YIM 151337 TaxID=2992742 RepID=UPI002235BB36|nr:adenylate/guanylate cyclase domain-containing protein [Hoyosella sp. YIM 151337]MCW4355853.1 adenylate/guanylate cyclase domain-containing protein [Hoyosella sp. YIM 151337]